MERMELEATIRKETGKGPSRRLRKQGLVPAVVYSPRIKPVHVALYPLEVKRALSHGENILMDLTIRDGGEVQKRLAMVKDYQIHPVKNELRHVDLYEISLKEAIEVSVALLFTGQPQGVTQGGTLSPLIRTIEVSCMPEQIPESVEVDCSTLEMGDTLHVSDLKLPPEIQVRTDPSTAVVTISAPEVEKAVVEAAGPMEAEKEEVAEPERHS
jgi:large subunit ribosomal protein L25